jgi:hypothetical protein
MALPRVIVPLVALAGALLLASQDANTFDTRGYPADKVESARLTERRCTKCHTLSRVIDAPLSGDDWTDVVRDMAKKEKSGIAESEIATIAGFLAFRSTRTAGAPRSDGAASRPAVFGGTAAYRTPDAALYASAKLAPEAGLPATLDLAGTKVAVSKAATESGAEGLTRATARAAAGEIEGDLQLALTEGKFATSGLTLRTWSIGPHAFRMDLAVYQADPAAAGAPRGEITFALVVVRVK